MNVSVHDEGAFDRIATDNCYIFGFRTAPHFNLTSIPLADGTAMAPGDCFIEFSGAKTSAGYPAVALVAGHLQYIGLTSIADFKLLCFEYWKEGSLVCPNGGEYQSAYYGFIYLDKEHWFFSTPALSGRVVQTEIVVRLPGSTSLIPDQAKIRA